MAMQYQEHSVQERDIQTFPHVNKILSEMISWKGFTHWHQ